MADADVPVRKYRDELAVAGLELRMPVHVDHVELETELWTYRFQRHLHVLAEMAGGAAVKRQAEAALGRWSAHSIRSGM